MNHRLRLAAATTLAISHCAARASNHDDIGFTALRAELGASIPTGAGVGASHVESSGGAATDYVPEAGSGTFTGTGLYAGKTFRALSGPGTYSQHADFVALHYYSLSTNADVYRATMTPGIMQIDCYQAIGAMSGSERTGWIDDGFLSPSNSDTAPMTETKQVVNHSWITEADDASPAVLNDVLRRTDFLINRDGIMMCCGVNNGSAQPLPALMVAGYNTVSVGLSNGNHSAGPVAAALDGPGRLKPEIVSPDNATSFATGMVSSACAFLRQQANGVGGNAPKPEVIKACLLAGATQEEFPGWTKTAMHPLDATYGAGELNIFHSYHIMAGGAQMANQTTPRPNQAWGYATVSAGTPADYRLQIPAGMAGAELSAMAVWHRTLTDPAGGGFNLAPDPLPNFNLELFRDPAGGGPTVSLDASTSAIYNLEHVRAGELPPGNYRLRLTLAAGSNRNVALAWRLLLKPDVPVPVITQPGDPLQFTIAPLINGGRYDVQSSTDMAAWTVVESFTAGAINRVMIVPAADQRRYWRVVPIPL